MAGTVKSFGRICYVEPNAFDDESNLYYRSSSQTTEKGRSSTKPSGPSNTQIMHDYEDYQIAVDLLVETRSRYSFQDEVSRDNIGFGKVFAHFIGGNYDQKKTTWFLSTDYSDYDERTILKGTNHESIGITNISISFENYFTPRVNIDFVDVRGASFMLPEEGAYISQLNYEKTHGYDGMLINPKKGSFFSSLLSFPPPHFYLRVKGIYGGAVTFKLLPDNTQITFDDANGCFSIKVTFVGLQQAMLSEIPFSLLYASQLTNKGKSITKKNNYVFTGRNNGISIPTIAEYCRKVEDVTKENVKLYSEEEKNKTLNKLMAKSLTYNTLSLIFPTLGDDWVYSIPTGCYIGGFNLNNSAAQNRHKEFLDICSRFTDFVKQYTESDEAIPEYLKVYASNIKTISGGYKKELNRTDAVKYDFIVSKNESGDNSIKEVIKGTQDEIKSMLSNSKNLSEIFNGCNEGDEFVIYVVYSGIECHSKLLESTGEFGRKIEEFQNRDDAVKNMAIENYLGFVPSLRNINSIILSGLQTFITLFFDYLGQIWTDTKANKRKYKNFIRSSSDTDVNCLDNADLPPFPLFTETISTRQGQKREMVWPPSYDSRLSEMPEVKFVYELLNAVERNGINLQEEEEKAAYKLLGENPEITKGDFYVKVPCGAIHDFMPLSPCDFMSDSNNPYEFILTDVLLNECDKWIYSTFMCRDTFIEQTLDFEYLSRVNKITEVANTVGVIEAYNTYLALYKKYSYKDLFPNGSNVKAFRFDSDGSDNFFDNGQYNWVKTNSGKTFLPIACNTSRVSAFSEEYIYQYKQTEEDSDIKDLVIKYGTPNTRQDGCIVCDIEKVTKAISNISDIKSLNTKPVSEQNLFGIENSKNRSVYTNSIFKSGYDERNTIGKLIAGGGDVVYDSNFSYVVYRTIGGKYDKRYSAPIFLTSLYYDQKSIEAQAYLFLMSIKTNGNNGFMDGNAYNVIRTYIDVLCEGAFYWRKNHIKKTGFDPIINADKARLSPDSLNRVVINGEQHLVFNDGYNAPNLINNPGRESLSKMFVTFANSEEFTKLNYDVKLKKGKNEYFTAEDFKDFDAVTFKEFNKQYKLLGVSEKETESDTMSFSSEKNGIYYAWHLSFDEESTGVKLINKEIDSLLSKCVYFYDINYDTKGNMINNNPLINNGHERFRDTAWSVFQETLKKLYQENETKDNGVDNRIEDQNGDAGANGDETKSDDIRLNTYLTLKALYEKWICSSRIGEWCIMDKNIKNPKFKFEYLDTYHRDIGDDVMVTMEYVEEIFNNCIGHKSLTRLDNHSIWTVMDFITKKAGCILQSIPFMFGQTRDPSKIIDLFDTNPISDVGFEDQSAFVILYNYKGSSHLDVGDSGEMKNDGFDLADSLGNMSPLLPSELVEGSSSDVNGTIKQIPAFGVTYGKQNQSYFTNISLSTSVANGAATSYAIETLVDIAEKGSSSQIKNHVFGQDAYRVYSNYSYSCKVTMLGNAMISPLMMFQLNNIPLWKGAYQIVSVTHTIKPGSMETTFEGYRMCKNANRIVDPLPVSTTLLKKDVNTTQFNDASDFQNSNKSSRLIKLENFPVATVKNNTRPSLEERYKMAMSVITITVFKESQKYGHIYAYIIAKMIDECNTKEEMKELLYDIILDNVYRNLLNLKPYYKVLDGTEEGSHIKVNYNKEAPCSPKDIGIFMLKDLDSYNLDRIIIKKERLSVTEVMSELNKENQFMVGDIVVYGVDEQYLECVLPESMRPIININGSAALPNIFQTYRGSSVAKWYSGNVELNNPFFYVNDKILGGNTKLTESLGYCWYFMIIRRDE